MSAAAVPDADVIVPTTERITIDGIEARVRRVKTRELLAIMNVMVSGLGQNMVNVRLSVNDAEALVGEVIGLMMLALPRASGEFITFLAGMVEAVDKREQADLMSYMQDNPDPEVLLDLFERIASQEREDFVSLVGKAQAMWSRLAPLYAAVGAVKKTVPSKRGSAARSRERST
jgi:hypothetical protein